MPDLTTDLNYRAEVDGLRALAVLPVIFYHAKTPGFEGGFIGVDIFLVISGYLITSIILREIEQNKFSMSGFYERRARRILPALAFLLICCLPFAWMLLPPRELEMFGESLIATTLFSANIYFWHSSTDYFAPASDTQPLLHMWSLGIEEQFYLLFPLLMLGIWRYRIKSAPVILSIIAIASFSLAEIGSRSDPSATFFLLPSRAWELMIGSMAAFIHLDASLSRRLDSHWLRTLASAIGIALIAMSMLWLDDSFAFPGVNALPATLGTALILLFTTRTECLVRRALSWKPLVFIGLISYSAYLWHFPMFAFYRVHLNEPPAQSVMIGIALCSLFMAYLSYRLVEQPFRNRSFLNRRNVAVISISSMAAFVGVGSASMLTDGFSSRYPVDVADQLKRYAKYTVNDEWRGGRCFIHAGVDDQSEFSEECYGKTVDGAKIWLVGDSHAAALYPGLSQHTPETHDLGQLTISSCLPLLGSFGPNRCLRLGNARFHNLPINPESYFILSARWPTEGFSGPTDRYSTMLTDTLNLIKNSVPEDQIIVVGCFPEWSPELPAYLADLGLLGEHNMPESVENPFIKKQRLCNSQLELITDANGVRFFNPIELLCEGSECMTRIGRHHLDGELIVFDSSHLTFSGSAFVARALIDETIGSNR